MTASARTTGAAMRRARGTADVSFITLSSFATCFGHETREPLRITRERRRDAKRITAGKWFVDRDRVEHAAGTCAHHRNARRQEYGLRDAVSHEYDGEALRGP